MQGRSLSVFSLFLVLIMGVQGVWFTGCGQKAKDETLSVKVEDPDEDDGGKPGPGVNDEVALGSGTPGEGETPEPDEPGEETPPIECDSDEDGPYIPGDDVAQSGGEEPREPGDCGTDDDPGPNDEEEISSGDDGVDSMTKCRQMLTNRNKLVIVEDKREHIDITSNSILVVKVRGDDSLLTINTSPESAGKELAGMCLINLGKKARIKLNLNMTIKDFLYIGKATDSKGIVRVNPTGIIEKKRVDLPGRRAAFEIFGEGSYECGGVLNLTGTMSTLVETSNLLIQLPRHKTSTK